MVQTLVVTGAGGFLGGHVCRVARSRGYAVVAAFRPGSSTESVDGLDVQVRRADLGDPDALSHLLDGLDPDDVTVVHCAAVVSIASTVNPQLRAVNVDGTRNLVEVCRDRRVRRLVYISSVHAIPTRPAGQPMREVPTFDPDAVSGGYAKTKAEATALVLAAAPDLDVVVVHPSGLVGPVDYRDGALTTATRQSAAGLLSLWVAGGYDFVDVRDVAQAVLAAAERGRRGECYLLTGRFVPIAEFMAVAATAAGRPSPRAELPPRLADLAAPWVERVSSALRIPPTVTPYSLQTLRSNGTFDSTKARIDLDFDPRDPRESVRDAVAWLIETGRVRPKGRGKGWRSPRPPGGVV